MIRIREDLAWAAGLFEGEGCFCFSKTSNAKGRGSLNATLKMTDQDVVERFQSVIGFGVITTVKPQQEGWKPQWSWQVGSFEQFQALVALLWFRLNTRRRAKARQILLTYKSLEPSWFRPQQDRLIQIRLELTEGGFNGTRWKAGKTLSGLARKYNVTPGYITMIRQSMECTA